MPQLAGTVRFDLIARKWHALAQRRLLYYSELYRSGRWTHYYASREEFAAHMLDVIRAAKIWARARRRGAGGQERQGRPQIRGMNKLFTVVGGRRRLLAALARPVRRRRRSDRARQGAAERDCARCHAVGKTGASPHKQAPPFRVVGKRYPIESLEEALAEGIVSGHPDMPEFQYDPDDVGAIIAYLKSIQQR